MQPASTQVNSAWPSLHG